MELYEAIIYHIMNVCVTQWYNRIEYLFIWRNIVKLSVNLKLGPKYSPASSFKKIFYNLERKSEIVILQPVYFE